MSILSRNMQTQKCCNFTLNVASNFSHFCTLSMVNPKILQARPNMVHHTEITIIIKNIYFTELYQFCLKHFLISDVFKN